jgi:hypothetical protein
MKTTFFQSVEANGTTVALRSGAVGWSRRLTVELYLCDIHVVITVLMLALLCYE